MSFVLDRLKDVQSDGGPQAAALAEVYELRIRRQATSRKLRPAQIVMLVLCVLIAVALGFKLRAYVKKAQKLAAIPTQSVKDRHDRATALIRKGRFKEASAILIQLHGEAPTQIPVAVNLAYSLKVSGDRKHAQALLTGVVQDFPTSAIAHNNLGMIHLDDGRLDDARLAFQRAIVLDTNYLDAHLNLGFACEKLGLWTEAIQEYLIYASSPFASRPLARVLKERARKMVALGKIQRGEAAL